MKTNRPTNRRLPRYERRLVLFIDVLGFKEIVRLTSVDPEELARLLRALDQLRDIPTPGTSASERATHFSDSFVVSYRVDEESAVFHLLNGIALAIIELAFRGYLVRGAVTVGDLYHTKNHIVGPALVRAYEMESREAIYPRVLVDPDIFTFARRFRADHHSAEQEEDYARSFVAEDADGQLFFPYVDWDYVVNNAGGDNESYPLYLRRLGLRIVDGLTNPDVSVQHKYLWLHEQYHAAIERFARLADNDPYLVENPEECEIIAKLPRYSAEADAARQVAASTDESPNTGRKTERAKRPKKI